MKDSNLTKSLSIAAFTLTLISTIGTHAQELMTTADGVTLNGTVRLLRSNAATCNVIEENAQTNWEELRHNQDQPLHLWEILFSVHNGSERAIDHLVAQYSVESPWPPCTNWTEQFELEGDYAVISVDWVNPSGLLQRTSRSSPTLPGDSHSETKLLLAFHDVEPAFSNWSVDYTFLDSGVTGSPEAGAAVATVADAQEVDSANPEPATRVNPDALCSEGFDGECWFDLDAPPDCYVAMTSYSEIIAGMSWSGECANQEPDGQGTMTIVGTGDRGTATVDLTYANGEWNGPAEHRRTDGTVLQGTYENGVRQGLWFTVSPDGGTSQGHYLDGEKDAHWVERYSGENGEVVQEGPYVGDVRSGHWIERHSNNYYEEVKEGPYVEGEKHGHWVERTSWKYSESEWVEEGPYVGGQRHGQWNIKHNEVTSTGSYAEDQRIGYWRSQHENGRSGGGAYIAGSKTGNWIDLNRNYVQEGLYREGRQVGHWIQTYFDSGTVLEGAYGPFEGGEDDSQFDFRQGIWKRTFADGTSETGHFVDGLCQDCSW